MLKKDLKGPNYTATRGYFIATKNGAFIAAMMPEHRIFAVPPQPVTDAAIHTNFITDLYAVIGEPDDKGGYVTRFYNNPLVPWIFIGAVIMACGGGVSLLGRRRIGVPIKAAAGGRKKTSRRALVIPITAFVVLGGFFVWRLALIEKGELPEIIPSVLIGKPAPVFHLPGLIPVIPALKTADLKGHVTLVNFFASWCIPCQAEHSVLMTLKGMDRLTVAGIDYQDKPNAARAWLKKNGNPYAALAMDIDGYTAIDFGVTGVPESYLIDKQGVIRFKQTGPLTPEVLQEKILPLAAELNK